MKKYLKYGILPVMALALIGAGTASAHGWMWAQTATPQEISQRQQQMFQQQSSLLGISVDEIKNYWAQGKTLQEIAQEKGITQDQLKAKMQEQMKLRMQDQLKALVDQGVITQGQADQRQKAMESRITSGKGKMRGTHGMMGW